MCGFTNLTQDAVHSCGISSKDQVINNEDGKESEICIGHRIAAKFKKISL